MGWEATTSGNAIPAPIPERIRCTISRRVSARPLPVHPLRCNLSSFVTIMASQSLYSVSAMRQILAVMVTFGRCTVTSAMSTRDNFWACHYKANE